MYPIRNWLQDTYQLIDINPFCDMTDPLLFTWSELHNSSHDHDQVCDVVLHSQLDHFFSLIFRWTLFPV